MEEERNQYYFNYLSYGSASCRKCRYATKLKSGAYRCRRKNYDIEQFKCFKPLEKENRADGERKDDETTAD